MSNFVILVTALIAVTGSSNRVESSPAQALDLSRVLELVKQQRLNTGPSKQRKLRLRIVSSDSDSDSDSDDSSTDDSDDSDNNRLVRLRKDRIVDMLETVANQKTNNDRLSYRKGKKNYGQTSEKSEDSDNKRIAKERINDFIEKVANEKTNNDRLLYRKGKKNYGQTSDKSDDTDNKRLVKERMIDFIETVANEKTNNDRLSYRKEKKSYGQTSEKSDDSDNKRLAKERIIDLIETVANANNKNDRITNRKGKQNNGQTGYLVRSENYDNIQSSNNNVQKQILEKLFSYQPSNDEKQQLKPKKRLIPNRLTPTVTMDDVNKYYGNKNKNEEVPGLEEYSKVYIVLNPQAVQNSKNKNSLNDLISKVLSLSSPTSNREPQNIKMPRRYKGFVVNENHAKRRSKGINDKVALMGDGEKKLDRLAVPLDRITAMPT